MAERKIKKYDVAVIGGGIAGISAALSAARQGANTLLVENSYMLGGLATSGIVTIYLPLCDGNGNQLSFGIAEELLKLSVSLGAEADYPYYWIDGSNKDKEKRAEQRYSARFNPNVFAILCEKLLAENGVEILYGGMLTGVKKNRLGNKITQVYVSTRSDSFEIFANTFVDATGDATLCYYAGEEVEYPEHKNVPAAWYYEVIGGQSQLRMKGSSDYVYAEGETDGSFVGLGGEELSAAIVNSHKIILDDFAEKGEVSPYHGIATMPTIPQVRMTRRLKGVGQATSDDKKYIETSVGVFGNWLKKGPAYELPLECLYGKNVKNLCAAGRCISVANDETWDVTRVIPVCAVSGEAAGILATVSSDFPNVNPLKVQRVLKKRKIKFHVSELGIK